MTKKTHIINEIILHNKRLTTIWQHDYFKSKAIKHIDGLFAFNNIFSVYAYSTRKETSVTVAFARKASEKISNELAELRLFVRAKSQELNTLTDDIELLPFTPSNPHTVAFDREKLTPPNAALVKVFVAIDNYIVELNKARFNGDISPNECEAYRNHAFKQLNIKLNDIHKICINFHQIRKEQLQ
ncbi:hypothetical protein L4D77_27155 [Photobacterium frigidiphilum]|uniref:hypothetical protein n=1 Tax=Photobacterium frigidiphilum TaxID=264736 RepID=UPI003D1333AC